MPYKVLHVFIGGSHGEHLPAALLESNGELFGTTYDGGGGKGTVFRISLSGTGFTVLHTFGLAANDGANPAANLIDVDGTLYGTTEAGGTNNAGTVFAIQP